MAGIAQWELQKALYTTLSGDGTLTALVTGVYDHTPTNTAYPYVVIGDFTENDWPRFGNEGRDVTVTIHTWSTYKGNSQAAGIMDRISTLLEGTTLGSLTGWTALRANVAFSTIMRDADGETRHGVQRFQIFAHE